MKNSLQQTKNKHKESEGINTGRQVFTAMDIRNPVFWNVMSYSIVQDFQHFIPLHSGKYGTTLQKNIILIFTAMRTSNLIAQILSLCTLRFSNVTPDFYKYFIIISIFNNNLKYKSYVHSDYIMATFVPVFTVFFSSAFDFPQLYSHCTLLLPS
jgi:hypothetical protein